MKTKFGWLFLVSACRGAVFLPWRAVNLRAVNALLPSRGSCPAVDKRRGDWAGLGWAWRCCWSKAFLGWAGHTQQGETASGCARAGSGWTLGKISSQKKWSDIGTGCPGKWWHHYPWKRSRWGTSQCGYWAWGGSKDGINDLGALFQPCWVGFFTWNSEAKPLWIGTGWVKRGGFCCCIRALSQSGFGWVEEWFWSFPVKSGIWGAF